MVFKEVGRNCWVFDETTSSLGRRMTIIRCDDDHLFIHSCIRLNQDELKDLSTLGRVRWILVPNKYHMTDIAWFAEQFPEAEVLCTQPLLKKLHAYGVTGLTILPHSFPDELLDHITFKIMESVKDTEIECFHEASSSLILTDLVFNLNPTKMSRMARFFHRLNQSDRFGPTVFFRKAFLLNRDIMKEEIDELLSLDFDKIIMSHGEIVISHAKEKLESIKERF